MKVNFDCNYMTSSGYVAILITRKNNDAEFFGFIIDQNDNDKIINRCRWDNQGRELRGRAGFDLIEETDE